MITIHNMTALPFNVQINENHFCVLAKNNCNIDEVGNGTFLIQHTYTSNYYRRKMLILKTKVADAVLDSYIEIQNFDVNTNYDLYVHDVREAVVNPCGLYYNFFVIEENNCKIKNSYIVSDFDNIKPKIKKIESQDNLFDIFGNLLVALLLEPFFLLALIFTQYKLLFGVLMAFLAVFIIAYSMVSRKLFMKKRRKKNAFIIPDGFENDFISAYFSNQNRMPFHTWTNADFINTRLY